MKTIALAAITLYRRYISPYKGFRCAYSVHTGRASCSVHGQRVIARFGLLMGLSLIKRRLQRCSQEYHRHLPKDGTGPAYLARRQAGFCDCDCDVGDVGSCACDGAGNCGDFGSNKKKQKQQPESGGISI